MAVKNTVEVVVDGRVYRIGGDESQEYLHQIAIYINDKLSKLQNTEDYSRQNTDERQLLLSMNLADDYFKAKSESEKLSASLEEKDRELYGVRHDLIDARLTIENLEKEVEKLKSQKSK